MNVRDFFSKTTCLSRKIDSFSHGRTLSGHTWSTTRKFSILNLSSLHPYGKPCLDLTARLWSSLLAVARYCSATRHGGRTVSLVAWLCSHLLGQTQDDVVQWVQGARGLAMGATTPDTHGRLHGLRPQGRPSPQDETLWDTILLGASRKTWGGYPKDVMRFVRIRTIP